jgi:hypothetical protein
VSIQDPQALTMSQEKGASCGQNRRTQRQRRYDNAYLCYSPKDRQQLFGMAEVQPKEKQSTNDGE